MKLPSGREISIDSLADVAEILATEIFHQENTDEAEETVTDWLVDPCFSLSGTESPFDRNDIVVILNAVRPVAEEIGGGLITTMDKYRACIKDMVEKGITDASNSD